VSRIVTLAGYGVLVAAAVVVEVAARRRGTGTFGQVLTGVVRWGPARLLLVVAWLWLGWHLFVRVDWR
jgi:hypothetical protein